jgi:zinc protease
MNRFLSTMKVTGLLLGLLWFVAGELSARQQQSLTVEKLVVDPKIRYGKLPNGLTYYIRHNEIPRERAEFYFVQNTGSMQEEEEQRGLAHFLEHMAFNGSGNFPSKKGMQDFIESIGMAMGENMNAYTGFDETVYMLMNVPLTAERPGVMDSCLLMLHDWASALLLDEGAIEKERGVIREEWRTNRTAQQRLWEQQLPRMFPGSRYGVRMPIGSLEVIERFRAEELRDFYRRWYRPDLQAIVLVGDLDVDGTEEKIKRIFSDIPAPTLPAPLKPAPVPDNAQPLVSIARDREMTNMQLSIFYKHEKLPDHLRGTIADVVDRYTQAVISLIMSERFAEILQKANPPCIGAYAADGDFFVARTKGAWTSTATVKPGELERAMQTLTEETNRVKNFGFTKAEYERARENILSFYESAYNDRDKQQNGSFAEEYVGHFTREEYIPGIETEYELMKALAPEFPVEGINQYLRSTLFHENDAEHNVVISLSGPDRDDLAYPTEEELLTMFRRANGAGVSANEADSFPIGKRLIPALPAPGRIVREREDPLFNVTHYTLSNGVRAVVRQTDYKKDQILMTATSPGGVSLFGDDADIWNLKALNNAIMLGGLGEFSATNLRKAIAGKNVSCSTGVGISTESMNGSATPSDLKTLFELIYLQFTAMRTDDEAYASFEERMKTYLDDLYLNPMIVFSDSVSGAAYDNDPRTTRLKSSDFARVDYHRMIEMYRERFADASDFVFTFVGNVDRDSIRPLLEQYLAVLPSLNRVEKGDESQVTPFRRGRYRCHFSRKLETPKASVALMYTGKMSYHLKNAVIVQLLNKILDLVYTKRIREEKSASYGVQVMGGLDDFPEGRTSFQIYFDTDPDKRADMIDVIKAGFADMAKKGPRAEDLEKCRSNIAKGRAEAMQENDYWLNVIDTYYYRGFDAHTDFDKVLNDVTAEDIRSFAKEFLEQGNEVEVVIFPENNP